MALYVSKNKGYRSRCKLFVNDFNIISYVEGDAYINQIRWLLENDTPIDAIGVQGHFDKTIDPLSVKAKLDNLSSVGLPIWVTEFDIQMSDEKIEPII